MHLGPEAMKMIGESIAHDIAANRDYSWFAHDIETTYEAANDPPPNESPTESPPAETSPVAAQPTQ